MPLATITSVDIGVLGVVVTVGLAMCAFAWKAVNVLIAIHKSMAVVTTVTKVHAKDIHNLKEEVGEVKQDITKIKIVMGHA